MAFGQKSEIMASGFGRFILCFISFFFFETTRGKVFRFLHHDGVFLLLVDEKEAPL